MNIFNGILTKDSSDILFIESMVQTTPNVSKLHQIISNTIKDTCDPKKLLKYR